MRRSAKRWLVSRMLVMAILAAAQAGTVAMAEESPEPGVGANAEASAGAGDDAKYLFAIAQELRQEADYEGAKEAFERALAADPEEPYLRLSYAEFLYQLGDLDAAAAEAAAVRELREQPEALRLLARIELRQVDKSTEAVARAVELFRELSELLPEDVESRVSSGRLLMSLGRFDEAASALREAYELRPRDLRLGSMLLTAYQSSREPKKTEAALRELLEGHPEFLDARLGLANLLAEQLRHAEAVEVLEGVPAAQQSSVDLVRLLALELYRAGAWQKSLEAGERWLALAPGEAPAAYLNGLALAALGRFDEAEARLREIYEADAMSLDVARVLAEVVERQGRSDEAAGILSATRDRLEAAGQADMAERAKLDLIDLEVRAENWDRVLDLTAGAAGSQADGVHPELALVRGQALLEAGRPDEAAALFAELGEDPEVGETARARESEALFKAGRVEEAEARLLELAGSGEFRQIVLAARAFHRMELYDRAIPLWLEAKRADPEALDVRFWLGSAYERDGRRDEAVREFRDLLARDNLFAPALNYLGYMWAERGENLEEAVDLVKKAVALEPNNGAYIDSLGWAYYQLGEYEEALGHLEKASRLVRGDAVVFEHLGDLYTALGQRELAAESYEKAMALGAENADAVRRKLAELLGDS